MRNKPHIIRCAATDLGSTRDRHLTTRVAADLRHHTPDGKGLRGGLFVNRAQALKFAMFENGYRPQAVIMVPDVLELDLSGKPRDQDRSRAGLRAALARAA
jgi:hypothetical protein